MKTQKSFVLCFVTSALFSGKQHSRFAKQTSCPFRVTPSFSANFEKLNTGNENKYEAPSFNSWNLHGCEPRQRDQGMSHQDYN